MSDRQPARMMRKAVALILSAVLFGSCVHHQDPNPHARFRGLWKLHVFEYQDSTGKWMEYWWNKGGESYILYDGIGHMAVQITPKGYQDLAVKSPGIPVDSLTIEELRYDLKAYSSNYVYMANCQVLEAEGIIMHQRVSHSYPSEWNSSVRRKFVFLGDTLMLSPLEGEFPRRLKWIKQH